MFTTIRKFIALASVCFMSLALSGTAFAGNSKPAPTGGTTASSHRQPIHFGQGTTTGTTTGTTASSHRQPIHFGQGTTTGTTASSHRQPIRFSHGFYYQGRDHNHWTRYSWSSRFGCYTYYCPVTSCYYYWSEPAQCFYPISYADIVVPTRSEILLPIASNLGANGGPIVATALPTPVAEPTR